METSRIGKRGTIVVPAKLREIFGLKEGTLLIAEEHSGGYSAATGDIRACRVVHEGAQGRISAKSTRFGC